MNARTYWNPYLGGAALGVVLFLAFLTTGHGLGASGTFSRVTAAAERVVAPGHVARTPYLGKMAGPGKNPFDHWILWVSLGTILGGLGSGLYHRRWKLETYKGPRISVRTRWAFALLGGAIVGYGARMARGCTSGQGLSGGATLSAGSWAFLGAVFVGGYALAYFFRRLWTEGR